MFRVFRALRIILLSETFLLALFLFLHLFLQAQIFWWLQLAHNQINLTKTGLLLLTFTYQFLFPF